MNQTFHFLDFKDYPEMREGVRYVFIQEYFAVKKCAIIQKFKTKIPPIPHLLNVY